MNLKAVLGLSIFIVGTVACGMWAYRWVAAFVSPETGAGGFGFVSAGLLLLAAGLFAAVAPLFATFRLTRSSSARGLAVAWRTSHVLVSIATVGLVVFDSSLRSLVAAALFLPLQAFFANGALAIWIANPFSGGTR